MQASFVETGNPRGDSRNPLALQPWGGCQWYEIDPQTLGEFTGLLDKNGRRIYEGDIVATGIGPDYVKSIVRIGEGETMGSEYCHSERYYGIYLERSVGLEDILLDGKMLVIGNVWEHPELLK